MTETAFHRSEMLPPQPPPRGQAGAALWVRENLFNGPVSSVLTILSAVLIVWIVTSIGPWFWRGIWDANSLTECRAARDALYGPDASVACWAFLPERWSQLLFGFYPQGQTWRPVLAFLSFLLAVSPILYPGVSRRVLWFTWVSPLVIFWLLWGGSFWSPLAVALGFAIGWFAYTLARRVIPSGAAVALGVLAACVYWYFNAGWLAGWLADTIPMLWLEPVASRDFGGFTLSFVIGAAGIVLSLPLGILLALGRQSDMFIINKSAVIFIEVIRGVPLIVWLFTASLLLNYFLPPGTTFDLMLRVIIMVTLFSSAYIAEIARGGLAALPKGQYEAADSLGLDYWKAMRLIVLPQALKISIPGIVGSFIGLFKDTTLVSFVGLYDPINLANAIRSNEAWHGVVWEIYVFIGLVFFVCCYAMSRYSQNLEKRLSRDHR